MVFFAIFSLLNAFELLAFAGEIGKSITIFLAGIFALVGILFFTGVID